ncbi:MAG: LacI family transcriptional regulator [Ardenticatenaceae bacterium]|nr:LacI family transcriptional regulator [Ardenticatenaceae bacterium]HBY93143.1 LacI family transcriptional regulator [Chloroflexota bacterium]
MPVSIKDIARAAGVSHSTVSRALRGHPAISEATRSRVSQLAAEMGYSPSAVARGLRTSRTRVIGLVVTHLTDPFLTEVVQGIEALALDAGYSLFLATSNVDPDREVAVVKAFREQRVDGILVSSSRVGERYLPLLAESQVPIVLINNQHDGTFAFSVTNDDRYGAEVVTRHLIESGHERIAYLGNHRGGQTDVDRLAGYRAALHAAGLTPDPALVVHGPNGRAPGGEAGVQALFPLDPHPTGLVCYNDMMALGALHRLKQAGVRIPEDLSITGYDGISLVAYADPPLTTFAQPTFELGRRAMQMLLSLMAGQDGEHILLRGELIVRQSTAPRS